MQAFKTNTLVEAQAVFTKTKVTKNKAVSLDSVFDVEPILAEIRSRGAKTKEEKQLKVAARIFQDRIITGDLDNIDIWDTEAQDALHLLVSDGNAATGFTQDMRDYIEGHGKISTYKDWTQPIFDNNKAQSISYNGEIVERMVMASSSRQLDVMVELDTVATDDLTVLLWLEMSNPNETDYITAQQPIYLIIKKGTKGVWHTFGRRFKRYIKVFAEIKTNIPFSVDVSEV